MSKRPSKNNKQCYLNYTGSKRQYLDQILSVIPNDLKDKHLSVVDAFCGGASLSTSLPEKWVVVANDFERRVVDIHLTMSSLNKTFGAEDTLTFVKEHCHKRIKGNKDSSGYETLKQNYNSHKGILDLYALVSSSNTNRIRWNNSGEFNLPFGKRYFNPNMQQNLLAWLKRLEERDVFFLSKNFREFSAEDFDIGIFDPPYSYSGKSTAVYNENGGWQYQDMIDSLKKCDEFDKAGKKFIYFNEMITKDEKNVALEAWSRKYNVVELDSNINESSANRKKKLSVEVMIHNF